MDHRDAMNTKRRSRNPRSAAVSAEDQPQQPRNLAGTRWNQRRPMLRAPSRAPGKILARREDFAVALATSRPPENGRRRLALRPGGTPQEISRGQARASGRGPRWPRRTGHAPAGHRRNFWRRSARSVSVTARRLGQAGQFFDAPLGHGATPHGFRGRRPLTRTCPRLISSGVPPGRETGGQPGQPLSRNDAVRATGARPSGRRNARPQLPLPTTRTRTTTHYLVSKKERLEIRSPDTGRTPTA